MGVTIPLRSPRSTPPVPPHASFVLAPLGGFVGLFTAGGTLVDHLNYFSTPPDNAYGRLPDGTADLIVTVILEM